MKMISKMKTRFAGFWNDKKRRNAYIISYAILIVGFLLIFSTPTVEAKKDNKVALSWSKQILGGVSKPIYDMLHGTGDMAQFYNYMVKDSGDDTFAKWISAGFKGIASLAGLWVLAVGMAKLPKITERGGDPIEAIAKILIEICINALIIANVAKLMSVIATVGSFVIDQIPGMYPPGSITDEAAINFIKKISKDGTEKGNWRWQIDIILKLMIPFACSYIMQIAAKFLALQILIEIGLRRFFAPLAVADVYAEGLRSPGVRYFKKYLAVFLKLAVALLACKIGTKLTEMIPTVDSVADGFNFVFDVLVINFTVIGMMFKGGEIANDVIGA